MASFDIGAGTNHTRGANQTLSGATPNNSALIDMKGWEGLNVWLHTAAVADAGTADGFTAKLQHSDTTVGTSFADCASTEVIGANLTVTSDDDDNKIIGKIGYRGNKRYVRMVVTGTSGSDAVVFAVFDRQRAALEPVTAVGATTAAT
jgi:hypothetical protein